MNLTPRKESPNITNRTASMVFPPIGASPAKTKKPTRHTSVKNNRMYSAAENLSSFAVLPMKYVPTAAATHAAKTLSRMPIFF